MSNENPYDQLIKQFTAQFGGLAPPKPKNTELATVVNAQVRDILRANRWRGKVKPPYGKEEQLPMREPTYDEAVERARASCRHELAVRMEIAEWYCPQCKRRLDTNDVGAGGI